MPTNTTDAVTPRSANAYTGRIIALATLALGFVGAAAPVLGNLDLTSTAGIVAGIGALTAIAVKYLDGWQRYEGRVDALQLAALTPDAPAAAQAVAPAEAVAPAAPATIRVAAAQPAPAAAAVDPEEPAAPQPGDVFDPEEPGLDDEPADVPEPPDDQEIDAATAPEPVLSEAPAPVAATPNGHPPLAPAHT